MKLFKSINNNIISAFDDNGREVVVIGKGIGYKAAEGSEIPKEKIDKVFVMSNQDNTERLKKLFLTIPTKYIELTDEILIYAKEHLKKKLNENAYFTLADHINFALMRQRQGMNFQNVLLSEIRRFYSEEFDVGLYALDLMEQRLGVQMPIDEAASIALHIFNAEYDISISDAFHVTKLLDRMLEIIQKMTNVKFDERNYYCERFIVHLKFLAQRIIKNEVLNSRDDDFFELLFLKYPNEMKCSEEVLGKGIAIKPSAGRVVAPVNGKVAQMFKTGHAVTLESEDGIDILIHVGLDTVSLKGEHYIIHAQTGDTVKAGDVLMEFDQARIKEAGFDTITPMVICNSGDFKSVDMLDVHCVKELDEIMEVRK